MKKTPQIPLSVPEIIGNEWRFVKTCLDTGWVSSAGSFVNQFEEAVAAESETAFAVSAVNGTAALHTALLVAGVGPGDVVLVPALTFVATANAVVYCGAQPVFVDVAPNSWCMDPEKVGQFLERKCRTRQGKTVHSASGRTVRALLPVHLLGHPADMDPLMWLARRHGLSVVEDACEALGAKYKGRSVGSIGDIACFSFNGNKILTTGGGGMIVTNKEAWARRAKYLSTQAKDHPEEYIHKNIGYNYRLTNLQAAMGCAQMERLAEFLGLKKGIADRYREAFADSHARVGCMPSAHWAGSNHWLFTLRLLSPGKRPEQLISHLRREGIESRKLWRPLPRLPMYRKNLADRIQLADTLYSQCVSLPSSAGLKPRDQGKVIRGVLRFLSN